MAPSNRISRTNASFPDYLDFQKLREKGIAYCQRLASDLWTDFNLHDPGLTILEVLCYALTDLGYRTNLPIADLVARSPEQKQQDQKRAGSDGKPFDDNFFTAEQILTCNPVTILDLRRLLIDVSGVRNAWIELAETAEIDIYLNKETSRLEYDKPQHLQGGDEAESAAAKLTLDGLYRVYLELDDEPEPDACGNPVVPLPRILDDVWSLLHRHRNLCEDFLDVTILNEEQIRLCVDLEIDPSADPADVLLEMYKALMELLSPTVRFYSLQEMLARGKSIEKIYEGRPLAPLAKVVDDCRLGGCSHGFIDTEELKRTERRTELHASDLYKTIMQLTGVLAIRRLSMANAINDFVQTRGEKWCLHLTPGYRQVFDLEGSKITIYKEPLFFRVHEDEKLVGDVQKRFDKERAARAKAPLAKEYLDYPPPEGKYRRDLGDYLSIMHEFPRAYKIGVDEIEKSASPKRRAQVHQLQAYLLVYDQMLANYLAQLANLRELFSMQSDQNEGRKNRTYFTKPLGRSDDAGDVPNIQSLLQDYEQGQHQPGAPSIPKKYRDYLDYITERPETYDERRNRFLDHLLARFAESFTDYVLLMFGVNGQRPDNARIIRDKTNFLSNYPETSRDRGKGFDYSRPAVWDTDNVSGLNKRVSRLLGLGSPGCESEAVKQLIGERHLHSRLCHVDVVEVSDTWHWSITIEPPEPELGDELVLMSYGGFEAKAEASAALERFRQSALDPRNYRRLVHTGNGIDHHGFGVLSEDGTLLAKVSRPWPKAETRDRYLIWLLTAAKGDPQWSADLRQTSGKRCRLIGKAGRVLLETVKEKENHSWTDCDQLVEMAQQDDNFRLISSSDAFLYGFEVMGKDGEILAAHPAFYTREAERDELIRAVKCLIAAEGFHLVEHLLLRPRSPGNGNGQEPEEFLPIARECSDVSGNLPTFDADPYSFRATVVVPHWPHRFSEIKFRRFFERTLRTEAPAHVFLKICWVSPRQMRAFEDAYGQWRQALAHPDCDRTVAHNALINVLLKLRSVYAEGRLSGEGAGKENLMILDQTKLGSAGVHHDESQ